MSVILEDDEVSLQQSRASTAAGAQDAEINEEHVSEVRSSRNDSTAVEQTIIDAKGNSQENVINDEHSRGAGDMGAGDMGADENGVEANVPITRETSIKSTKTGKSGSKGSSTSGQQRSSGGEARESVQDVDQDIGSNSFSVSSGLNIVTQILDEILNEVVTAKEQGSVTIEEESKLGETEVKSSSFTTIKGVEEERGTVDLNAELKAQLAKEQEEAALQRQNIFQENVALFHKHVALRMQLKLRNSFLLKRMYEHYKRNKIEHLFKEMPQNVDMEGKYMKVLQAFDEARKAAQEEEQKMCRLINTLEEKKMSVESELEEEYNNLIQREREVARGLASGQSCKPLSENAEALIQRQITKLREVSEQRLSYFKLRDIATTDENHLKSLKYLGDNLTLMEFEQLKMQSQSCVEKLEERDAELHRLRSKATSAIQILAEVREKTKTLQEDIETGKVVLHDVNQQLLQARERLSSEKKRRDLSRSDAVRLRQEAGLLSDPKLLQDYRDSLAIKENLLQQLEEWKTKFEFQKENIVTLRRALMSQQKVPEEN